MPIYEYRCLKCGKYFELMRLMSERDNPAPCPECGAESEKLVSAAASQVGLFIRPTAKNVFREPRQKSENQ